VYEKVLYIIAKKGLGNPTVVDKKSFNKVCASYHQHDIVLQDGSEFLDQSYLNKTPLAGRQISACIKPKDSGL